MCRLPTCAEKYKSNTLASGRFMSSRKLLPSWIQTIGISVFLGFGGDPDCLDGSVTLDAATQCTATFALAGEVIFADGFESGTTYLATPSRPQNSGRPVPIS